MRVKGLRPSDLAVDLLDRSTCQVQVAAVLVDSSIHAWGWNSMGPSGYGLHAEHHTLTRANKRRLKGSTMYVAARRKKSGNTVTAKPCLECQPLLKHVGKVVYRDGDGRWVNM